MAPRRNPERSTRSTKIDPSLLDDGWFPDIKNPDSAVHQQINALNREAYLSAIFAKADDLLLFMAFAKKGKKRRHHAVIPALAQTGKPACLSNEEGKLGANICKELFSGNKPSWQVVVQSVEALQHHISKFRSEDMHWSACLSQYACFFLLLPAHQSHFSISLLYRYSLIYSSDSSVGILKMTHNRQNATFGLKAKRLLPAGSYIMETCSSMSLDLASESGPSVIESTLGQSGPLGPRLILGPFRLVNHDCKPNAQVSALLCSHYLLALTPTIKISTLPTTHACVIMVTKETGIAVGEEITVKYLQSGYYGEECLCSSCTGVDTSDLSVLKPTVQEQPNSIAPDAEM